MIVNSRKTRGQRVDVYKDLAETFLPEIVKQYRRLVTTREALIALFEDQAKGDAKSGFQFSAMVWVTIGAAVGGGILGAVFTIGATIFFHAKDLI